jgi:hypothetical protein
MPLVVPLRRKRAKRADRSKRKGDERKLPGL